MIARSIAYSLSALFFAAGVFGFYNVGRGKYPEVEEGRHLAQSVLVVVIAWAIAYVGGI